jgi:parallel beta-helix repeat protein
VIASTFNGNRTGIVASDSTITDCTANKNEFNGFEVRLSTLSHCTANENHWGFMLHDSQLAQCTAHNNRLLGIGASDSTVTGCRANGNADAGITAFPGSYVHHSAASGNTNTQIECPNNGIDKLCVDNASF